MSHQASFYFPTFNSLPPKLERQNASETSDVHQCICEPFCLDCQLAFIDNSLDTMTEQDRLKEYNLPMDSQEHRVEKEKEEEPPQKRLWPERPGEDIAEVAPDPRPILCGHCGADVLTAPMPSEKRHRIDELLYTPVASNDAEKTTRLVLQPMLTVTLLQCRECSDESRRRFDPRPMLNGKIALTVIMCDRCRDANKRIRSINNCDILPYSKQNYKK